MLVETTERAMAHVNAAEVLIVGGVGCEIPSFLLLLSSLSLALSHSLSLPFLPFFIHFFFSFFCFFFFCSLICIQAISGYSR